MNIATTYNTIDLRGKFTIVVATLILMLATLVMPTANAAGTTFGICSAKITLNLSPGLQFLTPTSGSNQSFGETGTLSCPGGTLDGYPVSGPGTIGFSATYAGTCFRATGGGVWFFTLPVNDNGTIRMIHHQGTYQGPSVGTAISFNGLYDGGRLGGTGLVTPVQGDCALTPMTKATFNFVGLNLAN